MQILHSCSIALNHQAYLIILLADFNNKHRILNLTTYYQLNITHN